jgi:ATP-binding cassette subfamily B protein
MVLRRLFPTSLGQALRLVWDSSPGWTVAGAGLVVLQAAVSLAGLALLKLIVDAVTTALAAPRPADSFAHVAVLVALAAATALLGALAKSAETAVAEIQRELVNDHAHAVVHSKAVELDLEYYENPAYYQTLHRAQAEAPQRTATIPANLLQVGRGAVSLAAVAALLLAFNWWVALVLVVGDLPGALVRIRAAWQLYHWQRQRTGAEMRARYFGMVLSLGAYAQEIRLFGLGPLFIERFRLLRDGLRRERQQLAVRRLTAELAAHAAATLAMYAAYAFVAFQVLAGALTLGDLVMYFAAFQRGQGYLQELLFGLARLYEDNLFLSNVSEFLALEQSVPEPADPLPVPKPLRAGIEFDHVDFRYAGASRLALDDVSFRVRPGERIAIVGPNGSGKTTLVKLICRLYDPSAGQITADGIPLPRFAKAAWRQEISVLFQEYGQYSLTARENIWIGNPASPRDDPRIVAAARRSGADAAIERLPLGYETVLGKYLEDGGELSVGEWQKLALARADLRAAQIVVLDEPTAALDALAEEGLLRVFWQVARDRITIIISHRLSTVRMADRIYVLAEGRIVEVGTHDKLLRRGGTYAELYAAQAQHYQ